MPCSIVEEEHVGVVFPSEIFQSSDDADGIEALALESGILAEEVVNLVESEGDDCLVVYWFVFLLVRECHFPPYNYIRLYKWIIYQLISVGTVNMRVIARFVSK